MDNISVLSSCRGKCPEDTFGSEPCAYDEMGEPIAFRYIDLCSYSQKQHSGDGSSGEMPRNARISSFFRHLKKYVRGNGYIGDGSQGSAVVLADTILAIGAPQDDSGTGATWVFKE